MNTLTLHVSGAQLGLIEGLRQAIDNDETIDIKVPAGIFTVDIDAMEADT